MLNLFLWSVERNSEMSAIFLPLEQLAVSVFGWLRKQQPHCCCFFTDDRKTICCLSGEQQMFKSLRTAKELFEVLQINELNCFTQQVSTFLFFCTASWIMYTSDFLFKRLFCKQGCEILHEMRHISANTFKFQQQRHSFTSACFYHLEKKPTASFW